MSSERRQRPADDAVPAGATDATNEDVYAVAVAFQRDLYLVWRTAAESRGFALTSRGYLSRPALRRVRAELATVGGTVDESDATEPEYPRLFFLRRLAQRLGLLNAEEGKLAASERQVIERYLAHPLAERLRICVRVWSAGGWWPDAPDPKMAPPRLMAPAPPRTALARRRLLDSLRRMPSGEYRPLPTLDVTLAQPRAAGSARARRQTRGATGEPGPEAAARYAALTGPLTWLGLIQLAPSGPLSGPAEYASGAAMAALEDGGALDAEAEAAGRIVVQPNFEVIAYPPLVAPALLLLDTCAARERLDVTARYRLTRQELAAARAAGWAAADIAVRLEAVSGAPLPANVRVTLDDWERHVERVNLVDGVTLLEVREPALLDALLADRAAARWVERRLTPTAALLASESAGHVRMWLLRRGELPAMREMDGGAPGGGHG